MARQQQTETPCQNKDKGNGTRSIDKGIVRVQAGGFERGRDAGVEQARNQDIDEELDQTKCSD